MHVHRCGFRAGRFLRVFQAVLFMAGCSAGPAADADLPALSETASRHVVDTPSTVRFDWTVSDSSSGEIAVTALAVIANPANVLSLFVEWRTDHPVPTRLEVVCTSAYAHEFGDEEPATAHAVFVAGLVAESECTLSVQARDDAGRVGQASALATVGSLPDILPELQLVASEESLMQPGWTLFNLTNSFDKPPLLVVAVDEQGRYRWYHQRATGHPGSDTDVRAVAEGLLVGGTHGQVWPAIIGWDGTVLWEKKINMHHEIRPYGEEGHLLYLVDVKACEHPYSSGAVMEYDRAADKVVWQWAICEHYTPAELKSDWSHLNTAEVFPGGQALLVSSRNQDALLKVDRATGEVLWKVGQQGDFELGYGADFYRQHAPEIQPDGHILLFDNGLKGVRDYSRALELAYDEVSGTAWRVWEYRAEPDVFAPIWGDADRLPNGNTLITFGLRDKHQQSHLVEVSADKQEAWHLVLPARWGVYRAERLVKPMYGYVRQVTADSELSE